MNKTLVEIEHLSSDKVGIVGFNNALTHAELPKEYTDHVPYMYFMKYEGNEPDGYLFINYIGGLEHLEIGAIYTNNRWAQILKYIDECETKLHRIKRGMVVDCPFCNREHYNKTTLKQHLLNFCDVWDKIQ